MKQKKQQKKKTEIELLLETEGERMLNSVQGVVPPIYSAEQAKQILESIQNADTDVKQKG